MPETVCPNINSCRMITTTEVIPDEKLREELMEAWCRDAGEKWKDCKRFSTKAKLGFCPDFVVPGTALSIDEIIDKFEDQI
jgi:hypothetical protein